MPKAKAQELEARSAQRVASREDLLAKKPRTEVVTVVLDDDVALAYEQAAEHLKAARKNGHTPEQVAALEKELGTLKAAVDEATVRLVFRSIGAKAYDALVDAHPATDEDHDEIRAILGSTARAPYSGETFPPALIAASLAEPELPPEEVAAIWDTWNKEERTLLFNAALSVNSRARKVSDLGKGSG